MTDAELEDLVRNAAAIAVKIARDTFSVDLDYSERSIGELEKILDKLYKRRSGLLSRFFRRNDEALLEKQAFMYGAYLGETIRTKCPATWALEEQFGQQLLTLNIGTTKCFPPSKVMKRLINGPEDAVDFYFEALTTDVSKR